MVSSLLKQSFFPFFLLFSAEAASKSLLVEDISTVAVPASVKIIRASGYERPGDGGQSNWIRAPYRARSSWQIKGLDGTYWEPRDAAINVAMFGAMGNGKIEIKQLQNAMHAAQDLGRSLNFGYNKTYRVGDLGNRTTIIFPISSRNFHLIDGNGSTILVESTQFNAQHYVFLADSFANLTIKNISVVEKNPQFSLANGVNAFGVRSAPGGSQGLILDNVNAEGVLSGFLTTRANWEIPDQRVRGIMFRNVVFRNVYYGANFQDEGDAAIGSMTIVNARRSYFAFGVRDHDLDLDVYTQPGGNTMGSTMNVLVTVSGLYDTGPMKTRVTYHGNMSRYRALAGSALRQHQSGQPARMGIWHLDQYYDNVTGLDRSVPFQMDSYDSTNTLRKGLKNHWDGVILGGDIATLPPSERRIIDNAQTGEKLWTISSSK